MSNSNNDGDHDVDDFLYGSDASEENYGMTSKSANKKNDEEDEEIYEQYNESLTKSAAGTSTLEKEANATEKNDDAMDEDQEDEEEDSDDDLDIILEAEEDEQAIDSQQQSSQKSHEAPNESTKSSNPLMNIKLGQQGKESSPSNNTTTRSASGTTSKKSAGGIDLETVGEYNGQPITDVDVDLFEDKPWRKPGADITDYFNYGFNELSWRAYCSKQKTMREKKIPGKSDTDVPEFIPGMEVPDFMKMGMMMPMGMMNPMMNPMMNMPPPPQIGHNQMPLQAGGNSPMNTSSQSRLSGNSGGRINPSHVGGSSGGSSGSQSNSRGSRR